MAVQIIANRDNTSYDKVRRLRLGNQSCQDKLSLAQFGWLMPFDPRGCTGVETKVETVG